VLHISCTHKLNAARTLTLTVHGYCEIFKTNKKTFSLKYNSLLSFFCKCLLHVLLLLSAHVFTTELIVGMIYFMLFVYFKLW